MLKNIRFIMLLAIASLLLSMVSSCEKKYPEGSWVSLRTRTARVANTWKIDKYFVDYVDKTNTIPSDYRETYTKDGVYSYSYTSSSGPVTGGGKWEFKEKDEMIYRGGVITAPFGQPSITAMVILRLKEKEFRYYADVYGQRHEFHLVEE
jgi:hypothetical protein